jgi:hypothetical protein
MNKIQLFFKSLIRSFLTLNFGNARMLMTTQSKLYWSISKLWLNLISVLWNMQKFQKRWGIMKSELRVYMTCFYLKKIPWQKNQIRSYLTAYHFHSFPCPCRNCNITYFSLKVSHIHRSRRSRCVRNQIIAVEKEPRERDESLWVKFNSNIETWNAFSKPNQKNL